MRRRLKTLSLVVMGACVSYFGAGCGQRPDCGPPRDGLEVLVEGSVLARGKLSLSPIEGGARLALLLEGSTATAGAAITGRGVCRNRVMVVELDPGLALADGSQVVGGQVTLANGAMDEDRLFGTWEVELSGAKGTDKFGGYLGTDRVSRVSTHEPSTELARAAVDRSSAP